MSECQNRTELTLYGDLTVYSASGEITYQGKPDQYPVDSACVTSGGNVIVLLRFSGKKHGSFENLLMIGPRGEVLWRAELPEPSSGDAYVEFKLNADRLFANSWSGNRVEINLENGKVLSRQFAK